MEIACITVKNHPENIHIPPEKPIATGTCRLEGHRVTAKCMGRAYNSASESEQFIVK